jgi:hypothetical protein
MSFSTLKTNTRTVLIVLPLNIACDQHRKYHDFVVSDYFHLLKIFKTEFSFNQQVKPQDKKPSNFQ